MNRLDRHVMAVQNRLTLRTFVTALAWSAIGLAAAAWAVLLLDRLFSLSVHRPGLLLMIGGALCVVASLAYAVYRRPAKVMAAAAIDAALGLKEKYSTALFVRPSTDPFAMAAVKDAERAADNVSLNGRFPLQYPRHANGAVALAAAAFLTAWFLPHLDLFGRNEAQKKTTAAARQQEQQKQAVASELPAVESLNRAPAVSPEAIKLAQQAQELLKHPGDDPARTSRTVLSKMLDAQEALKKTADTDARYRQAEKDEELLKNLDAAKDDGSPLSQAQNDIKSGDFDKAVNDVAKAVSQFNNLDKQQQDKAVQQAQTLAAALQKAANNPQIQQQINNGLQQMANNPQMVAAMARAMASAAQGNPQAAQSLAKMAQQMQSQMNNGQGPTAQQKQAVQQMMANMQAKANSQAQAQALAQAAQQLAQAMQGAQAQQGGKQGSPQNSGQANGSKSGQPQHGGQMAANGKQGQQANGQNSPSPSGKNAQPDQNGQQPGMADAKQNVQQQLQNLQAAQQDAQQMAAAQQAAQDAADQAARAAGQNPGQNPGGNEGQDQQANAGNQPGNGQGNPNQQPGQGGGPQQGRANGGVRAVSAAPASFVKAIDPTQDQGKGRMLASTFVKSDIDPGAATAAVKEVAAAAEKDDADDVDQDRVPKETQKAVRDYFSNLQK